MHGTTSALLSGARSCSFSWLLKMPPRWTESAVLDIEDAQINCSNKICVGEETIEKNPGGWISSTNRVGIEDL